jgi:hypothetical protein
MPCVSDHSQATTRLGSKREDLAMTGDLATRSDAFLLFEATRHRDEAGWFVQHPTRSDFRVGNLFVLDGPPRPGELGELLERWHADFAGLPDVSRVLLQWETPGDEVPFERDALAGAGARLGLALDCGVVMHARILIAPPQVAAVRFGPLVTDDHWVQLLDLQLEGIVDRRTRDFWSWRFASLRSLVTSGAGTWWGAFEDEELISTGGLFWSMDWARYQEVSTATRSRRRGLCAHLCYAMGRSFLDEHPAATLVIVADEGSQAERIYRRLGFSPGSRQWTLCGERAEVLAHRRE